MFKDALAGEFEGVAARRPWWQAAKSTRQGYLASGWYAIFGLLLLWAGLTLVGVWMLVTAASFLALAVLYLVSALVLRRGERSELERD